MVACDFIYDGERISDHGFIICSFDDDDSLNTVSAGSEITFNTAMIGDGRWHALTSTQYDTCFETTFQICKDPSNGVVQSDMVITEQERKSIMRWLNRKQFLRFKLVDDGWDDLYMEASFNLSRIELGGRLYGFELHMTTNSPYAHMEPRRIKLVFDSGNLSQVQTIFDESDEIGYIYPSSMTITCKQSGHLQIKNNIENRTMQVLNCTAGERIVLDCIRHIIATSSETHKISSDFNYSFFRIANTYNNRANDISVSIPCEIELVYEPVAKVVF